MLGLTITLYIFSALMGLAIGSFLNVVIYRLPRGEFFSKARSYCPKCGSAIKAYDNIPVLSYIILKGKCRNCKEPISFRYPAIELLCGVLWVVNFAVFGISYMTLIYDVLVSVLIVIAMVDFDTFEIPDSSQITILLLGLITFFPISGVSWQSKLIGCVCISIPMLILAFFGGMGLGDVKLYFVLGLLLGWQKILLLFLLSVVMGGIFSVVYIIVRKKRENICGSENGESVVQDNASADKENEQDIILAQNNVEKNESVSDNADSQIIVDDKAIDIDNKEEEAEENNSEEDEDENADGRMIAFGPFICLATLITIYFGDKIIEGYMNLIK